jgi:hypothetical protein
MTSEKRNSSGNLLESQPSSISKVEGKVLNGLSQWRDDEDWRLKCE